MSSYDEIRQQYKPERIKVLLIAESPPPNAEAGGSRHFYRTDKIRMDDRLFINTIKAIYAETADTEAADLEKDKEQWLQRFKDDGWYMIESVEKSIIHSVKKPERQEMIREALPRLIERVRELASENTKLILIKSNVFDVAAEPLREAGFNVLNKKLLDYPGVWNQRAYREKLVAYAESAK